ncbi:unnamed protein product [Prunus armeniaca]
MHAICQCAEHAPTFLIVCFRDGNNTRRVPGPNGGSFRGEIRAGYGDPRICKIPDQGWTGYGIRVAVCRSLFLPPTRTAIFSNSLSKRLHFKFQLHIKFAVSKVGYDNEETEVPETQIEEDNNPTPNENDSNPTATENNNTEVTSSTQAIVNKRKVRDGLEVIKRSIEKIRYSVAFWLGTQKREEKFLEAARQLRHREPLYKELSSESDWAKTKELVDKLNMFYDVTVLFSGTKYPTANLYFKNICAIRLAMYDWLSSEQEEVQAMALHMQTKFEKYWDTMLGLMGVATQEIKKYKDILYDLVKEYQSRYQQSQQVQSESLIPTSSSSPSMPKLDLLQALMRARLEESPFKMKKLIIMRRRQHSYI